MPNPRCSPQVTKKPKRVTVAYTKITYERADYECPACRTQFVGGGPARNVLRFICSCGQELIVER